MEASFSLRYEANQVVLVTEEVIDPSPVPEISTGFQLAAAFPNPFNPSTNLGFHLPRELPVSLRIFDVSGRLVRELLSVRIEPQGHGQAHWDGRDDRGGLAPGRGLFLPVGSWAVQRYQAYDSDQMIGFGETSSVLSVGWRSKDGGKDTPCLKVTGIRISISPKCVFGWAH
ncbi:MAG: T9SS type A sorting domain-containing protein [bacterium]|nr:T9SS type A sorting domain-containing protein [bacterium]